MRKILKFYADSCGKCKILTNTLNDINPDIVIEDVNIFENQILAQQFKIIAVPTLVMIEEDKELKRSVGIRNKNELSDWISN